VIYEIFIMVGSYSLAARLIDDQPRSSMSKLALSIAKSTNFHNPFIWIDVGECVLSFFFLLKHQFNER
jgi:hypothetical protein